MQSLKRHDLGILSVVDDSECIPVARLDLYFYSSAVLQQDAPGTFDPTAMYLPPLTSLVKDVRAVLRSSKAPDPLLDAATRHGKTYSIGRTSRNRMVRRCSSQPNASMLNSVTRRMKTNA